MQRLLKQPQQRVRRKSGFTILELLLVIALVGVIAAFAMPASRGTFVSAQLAQAETQVAEVLRLAQAHAQAGMADGDWGVRFAGDGITLFQGSSYAARATAFDETVPLPGGVSFSATTDVIFNELTGDTTGTAITLLSGSTDASHTFTISAWGALTAS